MALKIALIAGLGSILAFEFGPLGVKTVPDAEVSAVAYPFTVPKGLKDGYIGENPQILNALSVWEFRMRNNGSKDIAHINFELPFSGLYCVADGNTARQSGMMSFSRAVKIDSLNPGQSLVLTLWASEKMNRELEDKITVRSDSGMLDVEYPVVASGLLAWLERYKLPLSLALLVLLIATIL